jgi:sec-independent protein translocase protein TatA
MWTPGPFEMGVVGLIALLIFGRRIPEAISAMGKSIGEFRRGLKERGDGNVE